MQQEGIALTGRGQQFNAAIAQLFPFATNVDRVLAVLHGKARPLAPSCTTPDRCSRRSAPRLRSCRAFIRNSNATFAATAAQNVALANTIKAFGPFTVQARSTVNRLTQFAVLTKPLIDEFRPAAVQLSPALQQTVILAPELLDLMESLGPNPQPGLVAAAKPGIPALEKFLNQSVPWLARAKPYLGGLIPVINYVNTYRHEVAAFFGNGTAATQGPGRTWRRQRPCTISGSRTRSIPRWSLLPDRLESNRGNP